MVFVKIKLRANKKYLYSKSGTNSFCEVLKCNKIHTTFGTIIAKTLRNMFRNRQQNTTNRNKVISERVLNKQFFTI